MAPQAAVHRDCAPGARVWTCWRVGVPRPYRQTLADDLADESPELPQSEPHFNGQSRAGTGARVGSVDRFALPRATRVSRRLADRPAAGRQQLRHLRGGVIVCTVVFGAPAATLCRCCTGEAVAPSPMRCLRAAPVVILFAVFQRYFVASDLGSRVNG